MGRTDGKLVKFLKYGLERNLYINLNYEDEDKGIFSLQFPRFEKSKDYVYQQFAEILKDWYKCNGKREKYLGYSNGKAVFQAALKKSVYLVPLPANGKKIMFRFATSEEAKAKRKLLKEKERNCGVPLCAISDPSSVSSGYSSGEDPLCPIAGPSYRSDENALQISSPSSVSSGYNSSEEPLYAVSGSPVSADYTSGEDPWHTLCGDSLYTQYGSPSASSGYSSEAVESKSEVMELDDTVLNSFLEDLEKYFKPDGEDSSALANSINEPTENDLSQIQVACPVQQQDLMMPLWEVKFYWQLSEKYNFDSVLLLTFKKQLFIKNEGTHNPGDIIIPNGIWENREYIWKNAVELEEKLFLFFQKT